MHLEFLMKVVTSLGTGSNDVLDTSLSRCNQVFRWVTTTLGEILWSHLLLSENNKIVNTNIHLSHYTSLWAIPLCGQYLSVGSTSLWAIPLCGQYLSVGNTSLWAIPLCGQYLSVGSTSLWAIPLCGQYLSVGNTSLWAIPLCGQYLSVGNTSLWAISLCGQYLSVGNTSLCCNLVMETSIAIIHTVNW